MVYVLSLEDGYYYVGYTTNVEHRYQQHLSGEGAQWTKVHKPISIIEIREGGFEEETAVTLEYIEKYGINKVRGGKFINYSSAKYLPPHLKKDASFFQWETRKAREKAKGIKRNRVMVNNLTLLN
ncbi:hypothetical protein DFQ98_08840 [Salmonella enterica subsp. enterica serovar Essen]|nr:hypothetical protein [Salmonella enterica subsp. enterica serovar Essen]